MGGDENKESEEVFEGYKSDPILDKNGMKYKIALIVAVLALVLFHCSPAMSSWLLDPERFHVSVHGALSCVDCHEDILDKESHPDPNAVKGKKGEVFNAEKCAACHDDVESMLEDGVHGGSKIETAAQINNCLKCHDPHYELAKAQDNKEFDPNSPPESQCAACHELQTKIPALAGEDAQCLACHASGLTESIGRDQICMTCHESKGNFVNRETKPPVPHFSFSEIDSSDHKDLSCLDCHSKAAQYNHDRQAPVNCLACHSRHGERQAHDAHLGISCARCHLPGAPPYSNPADGRLNIHGFGEDEADNACMRCHHQGNDLGASSVALPAKSVICMPCHSASLTVGDGVSLTALIIIGIGLLFSGTVWFSGSAVENSDKKRSSFMRAIPSGLKAVLLDALLQRRLFKRSKARWLIHALIFWPFVFRFMWGLTALLGTALAPDLAGVWNMIDKNNPFGGFLFDLSGILVLIGAGAAVLRALLSSRKTIPGLPGKDFIALILLGGMMVTGFIVEGMRIAMTGFPAGSECTFIGRFIASVLSDVQGLTDIYAWFWYGHAVFVGLFIAWLPFSRMFHIITAPIVAAINASDKH